MRAKPVFAWLLATLGPLLLAVAPAEAAPKEKARPGAQRPAAAAAPRTAKQAETPRRPVAGSLPRLVGSARADVPALRGQIAVSRDRHAALGQPRVCRDRHGKRTSCGPAMSWTRGLEPAAGVQSQECPDGTMATPARGHENIIRCLPI